LIKEDQKHEDPLKNLFSSDDSENEEEFVVVQVGGSEEASEKGKEEGSSFGKGGGGGESGRKRKRISADATTATAATTTKKKKTTGKTGKTGKRKPRNTLIKRGNRSNTSGVIPLSEFGTSRWTNMAPGKKAAALKTYVEVYGKHSLGRKLRCITEPVQVAAVNLELDLISAHGNATFLEQGFREDAILKSCHKRYRTAFNSLLKTLNKLRDKVMTDVIQFIQHDVGLFCTLEDELDGFVREVGNQSNDVVRANPPPQPERMINLSLFNRHPSTRGSGRRKKIGGSSTHVTGSASSTRKTTSGGISSSASLGAGSRQSRTASGNRGKKTTGLRPVMNEFVDYTSRLSS
jgi:hypothetical protein